MISNSNLIFLILFITLNSSNYINNKKPHLKKKSSSSSQWISFPNPHSLTNDITIVDDEVWIAGTNGHVYQLDNATGNYIDSNSLSKTPMTTAARISIGTKGYPWVCTKDGNIMRLTEVDGDRLWRHVEGCCKDISRTRHNVYIISCDATFNENYKIKRFNGDNKFETIISKYTKQSFSGYRIAAVNEGNNIKNSDSIEPMYVATRRHRIFEVDYYKKKKIATKLEEIDAIDVGFGKHLFFVGVYGKIWTYNNGLIHIEGIKGKQIAVGNNLWVVDEFSNPAKLVDKKIKL